MRRLEVHDYGHYHPGCGDCPDHRVWCLRKTFHQRDDADFSWEHRPARHPGLHFRARHSDGQHRDPGRTAVFADQVIGGNASLELRDVQLSDAGTYRCSVSTARGSGVAVLRYRTGAFSTPRVHVENSSSGDTLQCEAPRWFPRPAVHWTAYSDAGGYLPHVANTSYELNAENITLKVVSFLHNVTANATYTCVIENNIAKATGNIKVTDFSITRGTNLQLVNLNAESVSSSLPACHWMLLLPLYLLSI
ncbi:V-set domain-containing T-cell activation inhibitor 1 isoform X3 [Aquila chrysaetos chrysaetos]|uniref:V-set domain-containing T-cell activation inhibitor 1 isoform X3 n=1 Tax=Aquila chrysaetos chrysaetos TaxID=223781 RepID=UPI001B7D3950|nr:V-set domain-containing T-cell activation inhibitor 1 isoform X3 [Aquila chrysaetos chrysaetos]